MDRVFDCTLEAMDWEAQGEVVRNIDTVFLLDVLEHVYNPWSALITLREVISPHAQLVISLPNVRNMLLMRDLMNGYWHYRESGLLDVTHIRFFTEHEALRMIYQTGFRVEKTTFTVCPGVLPIYEQMQNRAFPQTIAFEKGSVLVENAEELRRLSALQHVFLVRPAQRSELNREELALLDAPHPMTFAMGGETPRHGA